MTLRPPDEYEAEFMTPADGVLHREKISYPRWITWSISLLLLAAFAFETVATAQTGDMVGAVAVAVMAPMILMLWLMMATLRVTVSRSMVAIQYGPFGPKIPLDQVELVATEDKYALWKYGGYGIRYSMVERTWLYNMIGDEGQAVRIHYRNKRGALKKLMVASKNHRLLADKINQARGAAVVTDADVDHDDEVYFSDVADAAAMEDVRVEEAEEAQVER